MNKQLWMVVVGALVLGGCATGYKAKGFEGGFSDTQLAADVFRVSFNGNGFTPPDRVQDFALLRAAELCSGSGAGYFVVLDSSDQSRRDTVQLPGTAQSTGQVNTFGNTATFQSSTTYHPGQRIDVYKPGVGLMVRCLPEQPEGGGAFDTAFLMRSIRTKYQL